MSTLEVAGGLFLFYLLVYRPVKFITSLLLNNCHNSGAWKRIFSPTGNEWALITGATDGCGLEYAKQLGEKGYHLLLLSRSRAKLERVKEEIVSLCPGIRVETLAVDFSRSDIYGKIRAKMADTINSFEGHRLYILVNNVGIAHPVPEYFHRYPEGFHLKLLHTNLVSAVMMTELAIKWMLSQDQPDLRDQSSKEPSIFEPTEDQPFRGLVINISSALSLSVFPFSSTYGASKVALNYLGDCLAAEYANQGILVQTVLANQVNTKMISSRAVSNRWFGVSSFDFVWYSLKSVGREAVTSAHPLHKLLNGLIVFLRDHLPERAFMRLKMDMAKKVKAKYEAEVKKGNDDNALTEVALELEQD